MEGGKCKKCDKLVVYGTSYDFKCKRCDYIMCEPCDNNSNQLKWFGHEIEETDEYLCGKCITKRSKPKKEKAVKPTEEVKEKTTVLKKEEKNVVLSFD
jgi:hypothetical protein